MSRARVPCRGSRVTFFFPIFFFLEKVIIDAINVIKTNKKNLKNKWCVNRRCASRDSTNQNASFVE